MVGYHKALEITLECVHEHYRTLVRLEWSGVIRRCGKRWNLSTHYRRRTLNRLESSGVIMRCKKRWNVWVHDRSRTLDGLEWSCVIKALIEKTE
jgi:hypothetical protein